MEVGINKFGKSVLFIILVLGKPGSFLEERQVVVFLKVEEGATYGFKKKQLGIRAVH